MHIYDYLVRLWCIFRGMGAVCAITVRDACRCSRNTASSDAPVESLERLISMGSVKCTFYLPRIWLVGLTNELQYMNQQSMNLTKSYLCTLDLTMQCHSNNCEILTSWFSCSRFVKAVGLHLWDSGLLMKLNCLTSTILWIFMHSWSVSLRLERSRNVPKVKHSKRTKTIPLQ